MKQIEKIRLAINQIPINNCDGSANEDAIKAIRYLQEVSEALTLTDVSQQRELLKPLPPNECDVCGVLIDYRLKTCSGCGF